MHGRGGATRQRSTSRGQTETIGLVLVLSMTLIGATVALAFGATALNDARADSHQEGVRNAMTQLDSQAALVALGDSSTQRMTLASGSYHVDPDAGWMNITHHNYTGDGHVQPIYNESLGAFAYTDDDITVAYQGGGVWMSAGERSQMVSPPEFHYQGSTLTLPIVRLVDGDSKSGTVTARISSDGALTRIYPSGQFYDETSAPYANPVSEGNVSVTVQSAYYQAWADYFRSRTTGEITVYDSNQTVRVILTTPSTLGDFQVPSEGNALSFQQLGEGHPISEFNLTLQAKNPGGGNPSYFNGMEWNFQHDGVREFEMMFAGEPCANNNPYLDISLYYHDGSGVYQGWQVHLDDSDLSNDVIVDVECSEGVMDVDLMSSEELTYQENIDTTFDTSSLSFNDVTTLGAHDPPHTDRTYDATAGESEQLGFLINHYLELLGPNVDLIVSDDGGGKGNSASQIDEEASTGSLDYEQGGGPKFITYLHITENRVIVELE